MSYKNNKDEEYIARKKIRQRNLLAKQMQDPEFREIRRQSASKVFRDLWDNDEKFREKAILNGKYGSKKGWHDSPKSGLQRYLSSYELIAFKLLDKLSEVIRYESNSLRIPYTLNDKIRTYTIDIVIYYKSGKKDLVEIKPQCFVDTPDEIDIIKWDAAKCYANDNGAEFHIWSEKEINCAVV